MSTKSKCDGNTLNRKKKDVLNDIDLLSESLMIKLVHREMTRIVRTAEMLCIAVVCFEKLLNNSTDQIGTDTKIQQFFKSVAKLKRNVRETDLVGWLKKESTFGIVFTVKNYECREIIESKIQEMLEIASHNANGVSIDIDVTMWPSENDIRNSENVETVIQNYFKKKNLFMNQE